MGLLYTVIKCHISKNASNQQEIGPKDYFKKQKNLQRWISKVFFFFLGTKTQPSHIYKDQIRILTFFLKEGILSPELIWITFVFSASTIIDRSLDSSNN